MKQGQDLYDETVRVITGLRNVYNEVKLDVVFVHGDTTTSLTAALAAFYYKITVAHIETGLRTHNIYSSWPEEMNRQTTSRISMNNHASTILSKENLLKKLVKEKTITVSGNTVINALNLVVDQLREQLRKVAGYDIKSMVQGKSIVLTTGN